MASVVKKQHRNRSRRRLAAISFLSNISLDGSHRDTKLVPFNSKSPKVTDSDQSSDDKTNKNSGPSSSSSRGTTHGARSGTSKGSQSEKSKSGKYVDAGVSSDKYSDASSTSPQIRWRSSTFSSEKEKSVKQKLIQLLPDSLQPVKENVERPEREGRYRRSSSMSADSNDSLTKETHFLSPDRKKSSKNGRKFYGEEGRPRHHSGSRSVSSQEGLQTLGLTATRLEEGQDISYCEFLEPSRRKVIKRVLSESGTLAENSPPSAGREYVRSQSHDPSMVSANTFSIPVLERVPEENEDGGYDPNLLDDPELHYDALKKPHSSSMKPSMMKRELNERFKDRFPNIQLTLTKLRSLKRELQAIAYTKCGVDLWTIAQAYVFFEKIILKHLVNKSNRKLSAAACMFLSAKMNDVKGPEIDKLLETLEDDFRLHRKEMMAFEFAVLVALEFALLTPDNEIYPHYIRLLEKL